jgi:hypothetical protein
VNRLLSRGVVTDTTTRNNGKRTRKPPPGRPPDDHGAYQRRLHPTKPSRMARPAKYEHVIGELRKNAAERVRVSLHEFNGHDMLSVRVNVGQDVGEAKPTLRASRSMYRHCRNSLGFCRKPRQGLELRG